MHKSANCTHPVAVDTKYIQDHLEEIKAEGIPSSLYTINEGQYSMYIDAVNMKMGESSYCDDMVYFKQPSDNPDYWLMDEILDFFKPLSRRIADQVAGMGCEKST